MTPDALGVAFIGGPFGLHGLYSRVDDVYRVDEPLRGASELANRHTAVVGHFEDGADLGHRLGVIQGFFGWSLYRHRVSSELEGWLTGIEVHEARRGGMTEFLDAGLRTLGGFGARRVRCVADRIGGYALARLGFGFDRDRLRGFGGDGGGVGAGGEHLAVASDARDSARALAKLIVAAALRDGRISPLEAGFLHRHRSLDSPLAFLRFLNADLARRLLLNSRWPASIEMGPEQRWSRDPASRRPTARFVLAPPRGVPTG